MSAPSFDQIAKALFIVDRRDKVHPLSATWERLPQAARDEYIKDACRFASLPPAEWPVDFDFYNIDPARL